MHRNRPTVDRELTGRVALVTGAGRGIGAAVARMLAEAGATTILTARSDDELTQVAEAIRLGGGTADTMSGDITATPFVDTLFDSIHARHGRIDIVINNAGTASFAPIADVPPDSLRQMLELNTVAPYACMRRGIMAMREGDDDGCIVNIGSVEAHWTAHGEAGLYPATKFALRALTMAVSKELKESGSGIRVCMVNPGGVDTTLINPTREHRPRLLAPEHVARSVLHIVTAPPEVHVFDTVVVAQPFSTW